MTGQRGLCTRPSYQLVKNADHSIQAGHLVSTCYLHAVNHAVRWPLPADLPRWTYSASREQTALSPKCFGICGDTASASVSAVALGLFITLLTLVAARCRLPRIFAGFLLSIRRSRTLSTLLHAVRSVSQQQLSFL